MLRSFATGIGLFVFGIFFTLSAYAATVDIRITKGELQNGELSTVVAKLNELAPLQLNEADLILEEDRPLAFNHYRRYAQSVAGLPIAGRSIRVWTITNSAGAHQDVIQVEARLDTQEDITARRRSLKQFGSSIASIQGLVSQQQTIAMARMAVTRPMDPQIDDRTPGAITWEDTWVGRIPTRAVQVASKRGTHHIQINLITGLVSNHRYEPYPMHGGQEMHAISSEISVPAKVFPVYELDETTGNILPRIDAELKYIKSQVQKPESGDIYAPLRSRRYLESYYSPARGWTEEGRAQGYWAMDYVLQQARELQNATPFSDNSFENGGLVLEGRYCTINFHQDVPMAFPGLAYDPQPSAHFKPSWKQTEVDGELVWEMIPTGSLRGRPLASQMDALQRRAEVHPNHDATTYINNGFDEIQVYYAVNQMFDVLRPLGFSDPDLSTRPFHAFLFDPDISMRDNAYYTNDTINFTTYSPGQQNMARDNPTIWHELGHGVMDRLMGDRLRLADTGGLSEGMADFVAQLVFRAVTRGEAFPGAHGFRIINRTGFHLTNEVHDDGEAYGGAMNDLLDRAVATYGFEQGLAKTTDVILEAMRLTRDHPELTAEQWFSHVLYADELGRPGVRQPGEMHDVVVGALAGRNFTLDGADRAQFIVQNVTNAEELTNMSPGSRERPIRVMLATGEEKEFTLSFAVRDVAHYRFQFPVRVEVSLNGGPLQGAIGWKNETEYPKTLILNSAEDAAQIALAATATCDRVNRDDGSCVDFAYLQLYNNGETKPVAKKRFYLRVANRN
jgi:hypothetical protein